MLTELCQELHNWFEKEKHVGTFTVENGGLAVSFLKQNQYYRICGSIFNDGVHKYGDNKDVLTDEEFEGSVWALAIPKAVINLAAAIAEWQTKYGGADSAAMSPFQSESFGGYSYSKGGSGNSNASSTAPSWKTVFASSLNLWRKI